MRRTLDGLAQVASLFYMLACEVQYLVSYGQPASWNLIGRIVNFVL